MAYNRVDHKQIADICDGAEYLGFLVSSREDKTKVFEDYLRSISDRHGCKEIIRILDGGGLD